MNLEVIDKESGHKILKVKKITLDINVEGFVPELNIQINDTNIALTTDVISQQLGEKGKKGFNIFSYLGIINVEDSTLSLSDGKETLETHFLTLNFDFPKRKGFVKNLNSYFQSDQVNLVEIERMDLKLDDNDKFDIIINKPVIRIAQNSNEDLSELFNNIKSPDKETQSSNQKISTVQLNNSRLFLLDKKLALFMGETTIDFDNGSSSLRDLSADWTHTGRKLASLNKMSSTFTTVDSFPGSKYDLKLILLDFRLNWGKELIAFFKSNKDKSENESESRFEISEVLFSNSMLVFPELKGIGSQEHLTIRQIYGKLKDITGGDPFSSFTLNGRLEGKSKIMVVADLDLESTPYRMSIDYQIFNFDMTKLNAEFRERIPKTFRSGKYDLVGELIKTDKDYEGYFKPFLESDSSLGHKKKSNNLRQFFARIKGNVVNWLLRNSRTDTVATKVPFTIKDGKIAFDVKESIWSALKHGLFETKRVKPRTQKYDLIQAQEEAPE